MADKYTVTLGGLPITDFMRVVSVKRSILPPREVTLLEVPARHGQYFTGVKYGVRRIDLEIAIVAAQPSEYVAIHRQLAFMMDFDSPVELILGDDPDKCYYAILDGNTDIDEVLNKGKGTLSFLCPDPFAYSLDVKTITPTPLKYFIFRNDGTTTTFPVFTVNFTQDATYVYFASPDGVVLIGNPAEKDQIVLPKTQYMLNDSMQSTTGWVSAGNILDAGRTNNGAIAVQGGDAIGASSYGTGTNGAKIWHGPAVRKDLSQTVKDFTVKARINFSSQDGTVTLDGDQAGRLEIYLFDQSGGKIGKLVMRDSYSAYEFNIPEIFIGNTTFLEDEPSAPPGKKVTQKNYTTYVTKKGDTLQSVAKKYKMAVADLQTLNPSVTTPITTALTKGTKLKVYTGTTTKTVYPEHVGKWNDFYGELTLSRVGTKWYAEVCRMDGNQKKIGKPLKRTYYDVEGDFTTAQLSYVVLHFAQYDTNAIVQKMRVSNLQIIKHNIDTVIDVPAIFQANDELVVDFNDNSAYLNGESIMNEVDVASTFFPIYQGSTEVKIGSNDNNATFTADFTERYL